MSRRALLVLLVPSFAAADPFAFEIGVGGRAQQADGECVSFGNRSVALELEAGYRVNRETAVILHTGIAHLTGDDYIYGSAGRYDHGLHDRAPIDLAFGVQHEFDRFTVAPWLGLQATRVHDATGTSHGDPHPVTSSYGKPTEWTANVVFGLRTGIDVARFGANRISVFAEPEFAGDYAALSFGVAFRR